MCVTTGHSSSLNCLLFCLNRINQLAWWLQPIAGWPLIVQFVLWFPTPCVLSFRQIFIFDGAGWKQQHLKPLISKCTLKWIAMETEMRGKRRRLSKHGARKHSEHLFHVFSAAYALSVVVVWYFKHSTWKSRLYHFHSESTQNSVRAPQV